VYFFLLLLFAIVCTVFRMFSVVSRPGRNAVWFSCNNLFPRVYCKSLVLIILSSVLPRADASVIGLYEVML